MRRCITILTQIGNEWTAGVVHRFCRTAHARRYLSNRKFGKERRKSVGN